MIVTMLKIIIGVIVIIVVAAAGFFFLSKNDPKSSSSHKEQSTSKAINVDVNEHIICEYQDANFRTTAYILKGQARVNGIAEESSTATIVKGNTSYHWDPATKKGFIFTLTEENKKALGDTQQPFSPEKVDEMVASKDNNCRNEHFDESLLQVPNDVTFTDMSEQFNDKVKNIPQNLPSNIPSASPSSMP